MNRETTDYFTDYELDLEKVDEPEIKLPTSFVIEKARESRKTSTCSFDQEKAFYYISSVQFSRSVVSDSL